ncbi:hypothetical protein [Halobiforma nitratireducens]|uniref:Uncharacterized protein n=1 Tax=Halobiforma nitratireducens JCM 10879 TaxID=1227454 RepID=M0M146_9EURY|nr:hypothetical protein [Halobiforma nitratireducens]EMA39512.1 hypothetical protein C446_08696 [Halobiforma nitratireducens JCM 10879]
MDRDTVRTVGKLLLATLAAILLLSLMSLLPGIDRVIPGTPVTFVAVVGAIVTVAIVALLLYLAPALASLLRSTLEGPPSIVDDVASIVQLFVVLVAVLVAHRGLEPAIAPLLGDLAWTYDVVFLVIALGPLAILAARIYVSIDPIAELFADRVVGDEGGTDEADSSRKIDTDDGTTRTGGK